MELITKDYESDLLERLKDPGYAAEYLNAILTDPDRDDVEKRFLIALRHVAQAKGIADVAEQAKIARQHLYSLVSKKGNPEFYTLMSLLEALGLQFKLEPMKIAS